MKRSPTKSTRQSKSSRRDPSTATVHSPDDAGKSALAWLRQHGTKHNREGMKRYGLPSDNAFGIPVNVLQKYAKKLGRNHELAAALWETGWYEARMLASFVDEPERVTPAQMDRWCKDFDNWGICDTVCFFLFDRTPYAFDKVEQWATSSEEFVRRGAFALLACLALHEKDACDSRFLECLPMIEEAAKDERNFVKKGISWALRAVGRRNRELHIASVKLAQRLAASRQSTPRWVGKDALRDLTKRAVIRRLKSR